MTGLPDCVALVTARGGSKRLPHKNVRPLAGKPLISWTIEAAREARSIRRIIVSTDDEAIADAARRAGGEVPFMRPDELAGDMSSHYDVVIHALQWLEQDEGRIPELLCLLQPTSPLRSAADIDAVVALVCEKSADAAFAVAPAPVHPAYMYRIRQADQAEAFLALQTGYLRSQDLEPLYYVNGAVYVLRTMSLRQRRSIMSDNPLAYVMPPERSIDIDVEHDFFVAEALMKSRIAM